jgi:hypothetical protein
VCEKMYKIILHYNCMTIDQVWQHIGLSKIIVRKIPNSKWDDYDKTNGQLLKINQNTFHFLTFPWKKVLQYLKISDILAHIFSLGIYCCDMCRLAIIYWRMVFVSDIPFNWFRKILTTVLPRKFCKGSFYNF